MVRALLLFAGALNAAVAVNMFSDSNYGVGIFYYIVSLSLFILYSLMAG